MFKETIKVCTGYDERRNVYKYTTATLEESKPEAGDWIDAGVVTGIETIEPDSYNNTYIWDYDYYKLTVFNLDDYNAALKYDDDVDKSLYYDTAIIAVKRD